MVSILLASLLTLGLASPVFAQADSPQETAPHLVLSTAYPEQEVRAGESLSIALNLRSANLPPQTVELEVKGAPDGWSASFRGGGRVVHAVYVEPETTRDVTLSLEVPARTAHGTYRFTVSARGEGVQAQLPIELTVSENQPPQLSVEAELPILKATLNSTFSYRLKVKNDSDQDMLVNFDAELPAGFEVTFKKAFGGQELASLPIKAGQTENVDASLNAAEGIPAGEYTFRVRAQAEQASGEVEVKAMLVGKPELSMTTPDGRLSGKANAGKQTPLELVLRNIGTAPLTGVQLQASPPAQWQVTFEPKEIPVLDPGQELQVKAHISPPQQAIAGDYAVTLRAVPESGGTKSTEFRITVVTSTLWGVVGLVLVAASLGVVALAVSRFGRR